MSDLHQISAADSATRVADVVFVHGLGGDALSTWRHGTDEASSWPHWLAQDFPSVGVWSIGYAASISNFTGHGMALPDRALQVVDQLLLHGLGERPLLFIGHSLGGLVVKQLLRKSHDDLDAKRRQLFFSTRAVLFVATPHAGSALASVVEAFRGFLRATVTVQDLRLDSEYLADLFNWYRNHVPAQGIRTVTYFEKLPYKRYIVVSSSSAHPGVGEDPVPLDEDHISIAKPKKRNEQICLAANELIQGCLLFPEPRAVASTTTRIPHELPPSAEEFFGRTEELKRLIQRLQARKNTAVVGPAGMGKTALAAKALLEVVGAQHSVAGRPFPDGVVFLDLYTFRGASEPAWETLANKLSGNTFMERSPARERATAACHARDFLLVIEGGEEADGFDGRASFSGLCSVLSPQNRWLLLTRLNTQAASTETVLVRDVLAPDEAAQLFDFITQGRVSGDVRSEVLSLLEGHPLALTWAANLLARDEESPGHLIADWRAERLPSLHDPVKAEHTLEWLMHRSVRGLDVTAQRVLAAIALLARAPVPLSAVEASLSDSDGNAASAARNALRALVQHGVLRRSAAEDHWEFTHVLGYRFARNGDDADTDTLVHLGKWLHSRLETALARGSALSAAPNLTPELEHLDSLLRADGGRDLWSALAWPAMYHFRDRLEDLGQLGQGKQLLTALQGWLRRFPEAVAAESYWLGEHSVIQNHLGKVLRDQGDLEGALEAFRESLRVSQRLAQADPSNAGWQRDVSVSQNNVGNVLREQGDLAGALEAFRESLRVSQRLAQADPSNAGWQRDVSVSQDNVGNVLRDQGDLAGALEAFRESLRVRQRLAQADPSNAGWQRDVSVSQDNVGNVLRDQGDLAGALEAFRESLRVRQRLAQADPSNAGWQRDVSVSHNNVGNVLRDQGDLAGALEAFRESLRVRQRLAQADPSNAGWQRDVSVSQDNVGNVLRDQGDLAGALEAFRESLRVRQRLAQADPSNAGWQRDVSVSHNNVGNVLRDQGDLAGALEAFRESLRVRQRLARRTRRMRAGSGTSASARTTWAMCSGTREIWPERWRRFGNRCG